MKKILFAFLFLIPFCFYAQGQANYWFFGQNAGINFNSTSPQPISGSLNTNEGCASFSDKNGNLLFYTDGTFVYDKNGAIMQNGSNLKGDSSSSQSAIIVPHPGNQNLYYIFTVGANNFSNDGNLNNATEGLHCYTVDITANNNLGAIIGTPIDLSLGKNAKWTEKVTSVKGADCNTFWVISLVNNTFVAYKIDLNGIDSNNPVVSSVSYFSIDPRGYLKVSPDGTKLASATYNAHGNLLLYSFDNSTGKVANNGSFLLSQQAVYGVEFSPLSSKLYATTWDDNHNKNNLFQFDLNTANIPSSKKLINSQTGFRGALQLAPNGKIYATVPPNYVDGTQTLNAINFPDEIFPYCGFQLNAINLGSGRAMQGLPPFIASLLIPVEITDGISIKNLNKTIVKKCIGDDLTLTPQNISGNPVYKWILNDSIINTTASLSLNNLQFSNAGTYYLEAETIDECGFKITYKGEITLEVYTPPSISTISNIEECDNNQDGLFSFDLKAIKDSEVLNGQDPNNYEVNYFSNQTDADANENVLPNPYTTKIPFSTETIIARIQNKNNSTCYQTASFKISVFETPNPPATISNLTACDSKTTGTDTDGLETFNLSDKTIEILNGQSSNNFNISYFSDAAFNNPIVNPVSFQNTVPYKQPIYINIINKNHPSCSKTATFNVEVYKLPTINSNFTLKQCDEDGVADGFTDFNLTEANDHLTLGDSSLVVSYYLTSNEAESKTNEIQAAPFSNKTQATVYARIENNNGCFRIAQVNLLVSSTHFPANYLKVDVHCDEDDIIDGKSTFMLSDYNSDIISQFPTGQNLTVAYYRNLLDAELEQNNIPTTIPYQNEIPFKQTLFVRVESNDNGECFGLGSHLQLIVNERPQFDLDSTAIYCTNLNPITVSPYNTKGNYSYQWFDENGNTIGNNESQTIEKEGIYSVIATSSDGCISFPHFITVKPSVIATISISDLTVHDDSANNSVEINTSNLGYGVYEFAIDNISNSYQDEPYFENISPGIHTLYVRDKNYCGIAQLDFSVIGYPKFFTPNNDGYNDYWQILGVNQNFYANSLISIFDRFGKLIARINPKSKGWDGTYKGKNLPASDYWFYVELVDENGISKFRTGHFSLIR